MAVFIGAVKGESAIQKRVAEVNAMINEANSKGIMVVDPSTTWQSAMMYKPIKFSRGVLFVSRQVEDLYKKVKTGKSVFTKQSERIPSQDAKAELTYIARMYRTALRYR
jgi:hypothetical protein